MSSRRLLFTALSALATGLAPSGLVAQTPPMPPGLDSTEVARARSCAVVEAAYTQGQEVGVIMQDSLIFMDGLATRLNEDPTFTTGSSPDGRAFLTFPAGEGELARIDTLYAGSDLYPLVANFRNWRANNSARIDAGEEAATAELQRRRSDLLNYVQNRGRAMLQQYQSLPQLLGDIQLRGQMCTSDVALLRSAVIATCDAEGVDTEICRAARADTAMGSVTFVGDVSEIWALQERNPWEGHQPLQAVDDIVTGGSVGAASRSGNALVQLSVSPLIRAKADLEEGQIAEFGAVLDSLGITFEDDEFAMAPVFTVQTNITRPLAGEGYYLLHTGNVDSGETIWSARATGGLLGTQIVIEPVLYDILVGTGELRLSAVNVVDEENLETVWSIPISTENRAQAVRSLFTYYSGSFGADLDVAAAASAAVGGGDTGGN